MIIVTPCILFGRTLPIHSIHQSLPVYWMAVIGLSTSLLAVNIGLSTSLLAVNIGLSTSLLAVNIGLSTSLLAVNIGL